MGERHVGRMRKRGEGNGWRAGREEGRGGAGAGWCAGWKYDGLCVWGMCRLRL